MVYGSLDEIKFQTQTITVTDHLKRKVNGVEKEKETRKLGTDDIGSIIWMANIKRRIAKNDLNDDMEGVRDIFCAYSGDKAIGAHHCFLCSKAVHRICGNLEEAKHGSIVICFTFRSWRD